MKRLFTALMLVCLVFVLVPAADAQVKFRGFTALTGGGTGALDKIPVGELTNGDIGFVATDTYFYVYKFNSTATNAESSPNYIRPDNYATQGVWVLTGLYGVTLKGGPSPTPTIEFYDSNATDGDINAKIYVDCTDFDSTESCVMYFQTQVEGTLATRLTIDASGNISTTQTLSGALPSVTDSDAHTVTTAEAYNYVGWATGAGTWSLPAAAAGMSICVYSTTAAAIVINPDDSDVIVLNGTALSAGDSITSASGAGDFICLVAKDTTYWYTMGRSGTWTDTN